MRKTLLIHLFFFLSVICIAAGPLVYKTIHHPPDTVWSGAYHGITDYFSYLSFIRQGRTQWVQTNQMTTERTDPYLVHTYYLFLGKLGMLLPVSDITLYQIGLFVPLIAYYIVLYHLIRLIVPKKFVWITMLLVFFTGPFQKEITWSGMTIIRPVDYLWMAGSESAGLDAYGRLVQKPHYLIGTVCTLALMYFSFRYNRSASNKDAVYASLCVFFGTILYMIPVLFFMAALGICLIGGLSRDWHQRFLFIRQKQGFLAIFLTFFLTALIMGRFLTTVAIPQDGDILSIAAWEMRTYSYLAYSLPHILARFTSPYWQFLILTPFAFLSIKRRLSFELVTLLVMVSLVVIFSLFSAKEIVSVPFIRLFFPTLYIAIAIVVSYAFVYFWEKRTSLWWGCTGLIISSVLVVQTVVSLQAYWVTDFSRTYWIPNGYIPLSYFPVFTFLKTQTPQYSGVMTSFNTGMLLVGFTENKVFIANEVGTFDFSRKWQPHLDFMSATLDPSMAENLMRVNKLSYVVWDTPADWRVYDGFLDPIYQYGNLTVLKYIKSR